MLKDLLPEVLEKFFGEQISNSSVNVPEPNEQIKIALENGILAEYKDGYTPHTSSLEDFMTDWQDFCDLQNWLLPKDHVLAKILYNSSKGKLYSREAINRAKRAAHRKNREQVDKD